MIDERGAFLHARKSAIGADRDGAQVVVVADAGHHEILAFGRGLWRRCGLALEFLGPLFGFGWRPVVHRHLVAALGDEMSCHGETHDAETEKSDFSHLCNPGVLPAHC